MNNSQTNELLLTLKDLTREMKRVADVLEHYKSQEKLRQRVELSTHRGPR